ncbi:LysR family transcriptional regulator [Anaeromyxobacter terrae]|uniref:LysR family transcriptional regulator n=1 Tax=Anaeromyxobacter terrae TaxID=2925406 RepID=UPI001F58DF9D|nr:LysR family transcriptional regulator [Anaeromyxobacter sp. SG22]
MDLNLLTVFEAVARSRSFSAAAKELGLPKSSVSRGVARLEAELGVQLLLRTTRQVALTTAGTALYDRAAPLLRSVQAVLGEVPSREEEPSGVLRVTAPVDLGVLFLAEVVTRYTARYPSVSVDLHLTGRVVDLVAERFDVALRVAAKLQDSTLVVRKVAPIVARLFASPLYLARRGTPRSEAELEEHDRVIFRGGAEKLRLGTGREPADLTGRARIVCDDLLFARDAVRAGAGIGLLPSFVAEPDVVAGRLVRVLPRHERLAGTLHVVTPAAKHVPRKVSAFRELVVELAGTPRGLQPPP